MLSFFHYLKYFSFFIVFIFLSSCEQQKKELPNKFAPKIVEAHGYVVPKDSMGVPEVILVNEKILKKIPVGKPKVVPTNTNIHIAINTNIHQAGIPRVCTPGKDTFLLPKIVLALDTPKIAGIPEVTIAKDPHINDNNPQSFSSFGKLQGLKHDIILCTMEDKDGNIWFGTNGGGVSKYDGKCFTHFTDKEGLSNNDVRSMLEDKNGNLWFGTFGGGVCKYDGKCFTNFTEKKGLSNNTVFSILEDKSGNIWFGTYGGGVCKYDGKWFTHFTDKEGLSNNTVLSMLVDKNRNIWFGTNGGGVSKYDGQSFSNYSDKEGLSNNTVLSILEDKSGNIWFGSEGGGVSKYDGKYFTQFTDKEGLSNNDVRSILEDKSENIWFGTNGGGVSKYDGKHFTHFTDKEGLNKNNLRCILEDKSGNIWFGTYGGGVNKYDGKSFTHFTEKEGLSKYDVRSILEDKSGNLWFGTAGGGVSKYDGKCFSYFTDKEGFSNNDLRSILEDKSGNLWFGTSGGGLSKYDGPQSSSGGLIGNLGMVTHFTKKEGLSNNTVFTILEDKSRNLWFGTNGGGVSRYDGKSFTLFTEKEGLTKNTVYSILEDKSGNLWFGTAGGGVSRYNGKSFTNFTKKEGLSNNDVRSILEDKKGNLWFGTLGGGVSMYDGKYFTHFTDKEGLSNNNVLSILEDKSGNLWFGTRLGLSKLSYSKLVELNDKVKLNNFSNDEVLFKNYTYDDGFYGVGCNGGKTILEDKNGNIWIGANDRLTAYHPQGDKINTIPPNIKITNLELFNEKINWQNFENKKDSGFVLDNGIRVGNFEFDSISKWYGLPENLRLAYNNNNITFKFIGITQKQSNKVKYQFKLQGNDDNWSSLTTRSEASYGNLPHGIYTFKVKAMNGDGYWSKELNYTFTIRPPWWKTWWFRTLVGLVIVGSIWSYIKWREQKLRKEKEILEQTVTERTAEVVLQKKEIEISHKKVSDSINYAKKIQQSILPQDFEVSTYLPDCNIFYQPKDVISGDFYWFYQDQGICYLAVADCTGHGVPGALISMTINSLLNESVNEYLSKDPGTILSALHTKVFDTLQQDKGDEYSQDGCDISLIIVDTTNNKIEFSGARNHGYLLRNGEFEVLKATPKSIGGLSLLGQSERERTYKSYALDLLDGDLIALSTDGIFDQLNFNDEAYGTNRFKSLIKTINNVESDTRIKIVSKEISDWKREVDQLDDMLLLCFKWKKN